MNRVKAYHNTLSPYDLQPLQADHDLPGALEPLMLQNIYLYSLMYIRRHGPPPWSCYMFITTVARQVLLLCRYRVLLSRLEEEETWGGMSRVS